MVGMIWEDRESGSWIIKIPNLKLVTKSERLSRQPEKALSTKQSTFSFVSANWKSWQGGKGDHAVSGIE